ncbi:uncharacterized protein BcabD6B2_19340 [Babesia caballi]|uniref:Uncharacterized protein n=1 Tax=Babesia caballi TaxID=5871 RepID=A0AAV4LR87_BABCB|nr:hypothetical protein BcabD6B2_19340 [Babesia caballi]
MGVARVVSVEVALPAGYHDLFHLHFAHVHPLYHDPAAPSRLTAHNLRRDPVPGGVEPVRNRPHHHVIQRPEDPIGVVVDHSRRRHAVAADLDVHGRVLVPPAEPVGVVAPHVARRSVDKYDGVPFVRVRTLLFPGTPRKATPVDLPAFEEKRPTLGVRGRQQAAVVQEDVQHEVLQLLLAAVAHVPVVLHDAVENRGPLRERDPERVPLRAQPAVRRGPKVVHHDQNAAAIRAHEQQAPFQRRRLLPDSHMRRHEELVVHEDARDITEGLPAATGRLPGAKRVEPPQNRIRRSIGFQRLFFLLVADSRLLLLCLERGSFPRRSPLLAKGAVEPFKIFRSLRLGHTAPELLQRRNAAATRSLAEVDFDRPLHALPQPRQRARWRVALRHLNGAVFPASAALTSA